MANEKGKNPKNIGNLGGPLLGGLSRGLSRAAKGPSDHAQASAREAGERLQGRAASQANRSRGILGLIFSNAGGQTLPTQRQTAERIQRGQDSNTRLDAQSATVLRNAYNNAPTVAAGKAVYVEAARNGGRNAEQAIISLLRSSSWIELQNSPIPSGRNRGKRVTEIGEWQSVISSPSPEGQELWQLVAGKRPDLTPDVMQAAEQILGARHASTPANQRHILDALNNLGLQTAISRFSLDNISGLDSGLFDEINRLGDPARAQELYDSFHNIAGIPHVGRERLGTFAGGPKRVALDGALGLIGQSYATI